MWPTVPIQLTKGESKNANFSLCSFHVRIDEIVKRKAKQRAQETAKKGG